jgi:hypothetical protein
MSRFLVITAEFMQGLRLEKGRIQIGGGRALLVAAQSSIGM